MDLQQQKFFHLIADLDVDISDNADENFEWH
jgi:hypothetical protein